MGTAPMPDMVKPDAGKGQTFGAKDIKDVKKMHWDFALVLDDGGSSASKSHQKKLKKALHKIHKGMEKAGLDFTWPPVQLHDSLAKCIYVTASTERLMQEAEEAQLK